MRSGRLAPLLVLGGLALTPVGPAEADSPTCRGRPSTIVAEPNTGVLGTYGDDVIVAYVGVRGYVSASAGDDVICLVDGPQGSLAPGMFQRFRVFAGEGDDIIENGMTTSPGPLDLLPGPGDDLVIGSRVRERVVYDRFDDPPDTFADVYLMGGGDDLVESGTSDEPNPDVISMGAGDDEVWYAASRQAGRGSLAGGGGTDLYVATDNRNLADPADPLPPGDVDADNRRHRMRVDEATYLRWSGLESFDLGSIRHRSVAFVGSAANETLRLGEVRGVVRLGDGRDVLANRGPFFFQGRAAGGPGRDLVVVEAWGAVDLDLRGPVASTYNHTTRGHGTVSGFEDADVEAEEATVTGTAGPNALDVVARRIRVVAGGGADRVRVTNAAYPPGPPLVVVRGGPGPDRLRGTDQDDSLLGGPGRDHADGRAGRDWCVAEVRHHCELR